MSASGFDLLGLPDGIVSSLLSSWLSVGEVVHIDSAYCTKGDRANVLSILSTCTICNCSDDLDTETTDARNMWICVKKLHVDGFTLTSSFIRDRQLRKQYLNARGSGLVWIEVPEGVPPRETDTHWEALITDVAHYCLNLRRLKGHEQDFEHPLVQLATQCPLLEELELKGKISSQAIRNMAGKHGSLKTFSLGSSCFIEEDSLAALIVNCPGLRELALESYTVFTDAFVEQIAPRLQNLRSLSLCSAHFTVSAFSALSQHASALQFLKLRKSSIETCPDNSFPSLPSVTELHFLQVMCDDETLAKLLRSCSALQSLALAGSLGQSSEFFEKIGSLCPRLRELSVPHTRYAIDDRALRGIAATCPLLRMLNVRNDDDITDAGVHAIALGCTLLEEVVLSGCCAITDAALLDLSAHCPALRSLALVHCEGVSADAIEELCRSHPDIVVTR